MKFRYMKKLALGLSFLIFTQVRSEEFNEQQAQTRINDAGQVQNLASGELQPKYYDAKSEAISTRDAIQDLLNNTLPINHPDRQTFESSLTGINSRITTAESNGSIGAQAFLYGINCLAYANAAMGQSNWNAAYDNADNACYYYSGACYYLRTANNELIGGSEMYMACEVEVENSIQAQLDTLHAQVLIACF